MATRWTHALQEIGQANRYVPLPEAVRDVVAVDHPLDGPSVHWNYEADSRFVALSEAPVSKPEYVDVGRYKIYDDESGRDRVRPPDGLAEQVRSTFDDGTRVTYLATAEMTANDNGMVYLLSTDQVLALLPDAVSAERTAATADGGWSLREALLKMPGILPPL